MIIKTFLFFTKTNNLAFIRKGPDTLGYAVLPTHQLEQIAQLQKR